MPIALERSNGIGGSGFVRGIACIPTCESPEIAGCGFGSASPANPTAELESCSSSSSIGRNSDCSGSDGEDSGEKEVQSGYRGPLETLDSLEESLPIRQGISKFYRGKSKSFTSLADVAPSSSAKDLAKPENAYTRKRKNLLAFSNMWGRSQTKPLNNNGGGISKKKPTNSSRRTAARAVAVSGSGSSSNSSEAEHDSFRLLPPLHPQARPAAAASPFKSSPPQRCFLPMRSFSLTDLQGVTRFSS